MISILNQLQSMPIYRLSLGSKELFHSNFLEFLWDMDETRMMFFRIINCLLPAGQQLPTTGKDYSEYELSREKENFDICVYHKEKKHLIHDLIIENKVKSIPSILQLNEYEAKIQKNKWNNPCPPRYLLLSLVDKFADKNEIGKKGIWSIANYSQLKTAIEREQKCWNSAVGASYVSDYCKFIGLMHQLQSKILDNFEHTKLFKDVEEFRACRLHDLYIKLRCCEFLMLLKDRLVQKGLPVSFIKEHANIRKNHIPQVYLNYNIFRGVGQAAAWLYTNTNNATNGDIHEIVIQGNQYRHGINSWKHKLNGDDKILSQQNIWNELNKDAFDANFLNSPTMPQKPTKSRTNPFNGYGPDYIYRYDVIKDETVEQLLDRMVPDITTVYKHFVPNNGTTTN